MRFLTPLLFAAAGVWVSVNNASATDRILVLPFLDVIFPAVKGDPVAQGKLTVTALFGLAAVFGLWDAIQFVRTRKRADLE